MAEICRKQTGRNWRRKALKLSASPSFNFPTSPQLRLTSRMKRYSPRKPAHHARVPAFVPVATRARKDGWTVRRQAAFLAALAITGSVGEAARRVSMARETAYRLRRREGAESFTAAWDAIVGRVDGARRKVTPDERARRAIEGLLKPVIYRGRHVANQRKPDNSGLLGFLAQLDRGQGSALRERERSQGFAGGSAVPRAGPSPPSVRPEERLSTCEDASRRTAALCNGGSRRAFAFAQSLLTTNGVGDVNQASDSTDTPRDTPGRTRTSAPFPACRGAARSGGIRR